MSAESCCSGDSLKGERCTANANGEFNCSWECSDENIDENGTPEVCHPFFDAYSDCQLVERQKKTELIQTLKSDLSGVGGILQKGRLITETQGDVLVFDGTTCNSREECLRKFRSSVDSLVEEYENIREEKTEAIDQLKTKYREMSSDVCLRYGEDGFCEQFKKATVPSEFMIVSKTDKMDTFARRYDQMMIDASQNGGKKDVTTLEGLPSGLYMDSHPAFCWSRAGKEYVPCNPVDADQKFEYEVDEKENTSCSGTNIEKDSAAPLSGYTKESCRYLCDNHDGCTAAWYEPVRNMPDGSQISGYCHIFSKHTGDTPKDGSVCFQYTTTQGGDRVIGGAEELDPRAFEKRFIWKHPVPY
jgi:hypothetical protein